MTDYEQARETEYDTCDICGSDLIPYENDMTECSACHAEGCYVCLERGDDVFPWICPGGCHEYE